MAISAVNVFLWFCWMSVLFHPTTSATERGWSGWYNSDNPRLKGVDNETVGRIAVIFELPCQPSQVEEVECREFGTNQSFSERNITNGNTLLVPCNTTGLVCRNEDQTPEAGRVKCVDYEIRILCAASTNSNNKQDGYYDVVGSNGGFIALAAGGSVVVPLVFVLVIQLRKSKREERRRIRQERQAAEDRARIETAARAAGAPPAYDELFGSNTAVSVISGSSGESARTGSAELLIQNEVQSQQASASSQSAAVSSPITAPFPFSSVITSLAIHSAGLSSQTAVSGVTSLSDSQQSLPARRESAESMSDAASQSSTDALLPPPSPNDHITHEDPPPPYDGPGGHSSAVTFVSSVSTNNSSCNSSSSSGSAPSAVPQRRFLGMHLSIFDLMAVIYPDPVATPPPTYDDALKILGVHKRPEIQVT